MKSRTIKIGKVKVEIQANDYVILSPISAEFGTGDKRIIKENAQQSFSKVPITPKQVNEIDFTGCKVEDSIKMGMEVRKYIFQ